MKNESIVAWKEVNVPVKVKKECLSYRHYKKRNKKSGIKFYMGYGDLPVWVFNDITKQFETVVNPRGLAYASRNQLRYKKRIKK